MSLTNNPSAEAPSGQTPNDPVPIIRSSSPPVDPKRRSTGAEVSASVLFNIIVPIALIVVGVMAVRFFGVASAPPRAAGDDTRVARLEALDAVRVDRIQSLESTGEELQLIVDGTVVPYREARVATEIAGRIVGKEAICEAGSIVTKGQLLMKIDPTDYDLEVDRLTRQKEQAYQSLLELDQERANTARMIKMAEQDVALQNRELKRQESLPKGFASRGEIDQAKRAVLQSEQGLMSDQNQLDLIDKRRARLESSEKLAAVQLKAAELNLERTRIVAPIDGVIVMENADVNSFVSRGTVLLTIEDTSKVEVSTNLRMDQLYWVLDQKHQPTKNKRAGYDLPDTEAIIQYDLPGRDDVTHRWKGRLLSYDGVGLDPQTRTVPVRVLVDDPKSYQAAKIPGENGSQPSGAPTALLRGMYVQVKLKIKPQTPLVVIPGTALQPGNRVWQFVPDESVLDAPVAAEVDGEASMEPMASDEKDSGQSGSESSDAELAKTDQPDSNKSQSTFKADEWTPGRVIVQQNVFPVDSLTYSVEGQPDSTALSESSLSGERQFWVCETKSNSSDGVVFAANALVVTSPLSGVDEGGLAARAKLPSKSDGPAKQQADDDTAGNKAAGGNKAAAGESEQQSVGGQPQESSQGDAS